MTSALSLAPPALNKSMVQATLAPSRSGERSRSPKGRARAAAWMPPVKGWTIAERFAVGDSGVYAASLSFKSQPIGLSFAALHSPFNASSFNPSDVRKTLTLRLPREWEEAFECMEAALLERVASNSATIFGREMPEEQVREMYKGVTRKTGDYPMNLRVKVQSAGLHPTRYWTSSGARAEPPVTHECKDYNVRACLRSLWFGEDAWGLVVDCTDLQEVSGDNEPCPFT